MLFFLKFYFVSFCLYFDRKERQEALREESRTGKDSNLDQKHCCTVYWSAAHKAMALVIQIFTIFIYIINLFYYDDNDDFVANLYHEV